MNAPIPICLDPQTPDAARPIICLASSAGAHLRSLGYPPRKRSGRPVGLAARWSLAVTTNSSLPRRRESSLIPSEWLLWIPAFAGMTIKGAGKTVKRTGMTMRGTSMAMKGAGMTMAGGVA